MTLNKTETYHDYMLIGDNAGGVLLRKCGKTINAVRSNIEQVLEIKVFPSIFTSHVAMIGLEPISISKKYIGARCYCIKQDSKGGLSFSRVPKGEAKDRDIQYFVHAGTKQIIGIYY